MSELVADCPRCKSQRITFDLTAHKYIGQQYSWQNWYEAFCICRNCHRSTVFVVAEHGINESKIVREQGLNNLKVSANNVVGIEGHISLKDETAQSAPEHLPPEIKSAFDEGATCLAVKCPNAAATMFRLCVDLATRHFLPIGEMEGLSSKTRRDLGLRLPWLFKNKLLPDDLQELSHCIKEDGNDGAHAGSLSSEDAQDVMDFTFTLLDRLYSAPARVKLAEERRTERRAPKEGK